MAGVSSERWRLLSPYLDRALEIGGDERSAWLASLRADDPALAPSWRPCSISATS